MDAGRYCDRSIVFHCVVNHIHWRNRYLRYTVLRFVMLTVNALTLLASCQKACVGKSPIPVNTNICLWYEGLKKILRVSWTAKNKWVGSYQSWTKEGTVRHCQSKKASVLWSHHEETIELSGERDNARNNVRCTQARKTTHGLDGQHQYVDRTTRGNSQSEWQRTERDEWRKYVHGVVNPWIEDGLRKEQKSS